MVAVISLAIRFSDNVPLIATPPLPATPISTETTLAFGSKLKPESLIVSSRLSCDVSPESGSASSLGIKPAIASIKAVALGATSLALRVISLVATTLASLRVAETVLEMKFSIPVICTAMVPDPEAPRAKLRITAAEWEVKDKAPRVVRSALSTSEVNVLVMALTARAAPKAPPPAAETPIAKVLISEVSVADKVTSCTASISERLESPIILAAVLLAMTLPVNDNTPAPTPEAAIPTDKPRILA